MKYWLTLLFLWTYVQSYTQCTTYGSGSPVNFAGTCNETVNRNHNGTGVLTISGNLSWSSGTFFVRGPVVVTGSLTFTGTGSLRILVNGSLQVSSGGTVTALAAEVGADGSLTIGAGGNMSATSFLNDANGPATNTVTINGTLTVSPGTFQNNSDGLITGNGVLNGNVIDNGSSTFSGTHNGTCTGNCGGTLPVEFISFSAKQNGDHCKLNWITAMELNNDGFEIQRMTASGEDDYATIDYVDGSGTSSEINYYTYIDRYVEGPQLYRLKQIDFDGQYAYSEILYYEQLPNEVVSVKIVPTVFKGKISLINWTDEVRRIELISTHGKLLLAEYPYSRDHAQKLIQNALSIGAAGSYVVNYYTETTVNSQSLIKPF